jgi:hypothetical protein
MGGRQSESFELFLSCLVELCIPTPLWKFVWRIPFALMISFGFGKNKTGCTAPNDSSLELTRTTVLNFVFPSLGFAFGVSLCPVCAQLLIPEAFVDNSLASPAYWSKFEYRPWPLRFYRRKESDARRIRWTNDTGIFSQLPHFLTGTSNRSNCLTWTVGPLKLGALRSSQDIRL